MLRPEAPHSADSAVRLALPGASRPWRRPCRV